MEVSRLIHCVLSVLVTLVSDSFFALAAFSQAVDSDFTFHLAPGHKECFFQTLSKDASLEIEYQVLYGGSLDVDFLISSPSGVALYSDYHKSDGVHTVMDAEQGDYMFCFDNSFSTVSEKLVFFELTLDNMKQQEPEDWRAYTEGTDSLDMKMEDIMETINNVKARLGKSSHIQIALRAFEARDRNIQESNFNRVNFWSVVSVLVMMAVSTLQVYLVRSLFEDKRKVRT